MIAAVQSRLAQGIVAAVTLLWCAAGGAATFHVDSGAGDDGADGLGWATAFRTLDRALGAAEMSPGADDLLLAQGVYEGPWRIEHPVSLRGGHPTGGGVRDPASFPVFLESLDPWGDPMLWFATGSEGSVAEDLSLRRAHDALLVEASQVRLERIRIQEASRADLSGQQVQVLDSTLEGVLLTVTGQGSRLEGVRAVGAGAGMQIQADDVTLRRCEIVRGGGGICPEPPTPITPQPIPILELEGTGLTLENILVAECICAWEAGMTVYPGSQVQVSNLTVARNEGPGLVVGPGGPDLFVRDAVFFENGLGRASWEEDPGGHVDPGLNVTYSLVQGGYAGTGNIDADPLFLAGPMGAYYLSQTAAGQPADSPALDAGSRLASEAGLDTRATRTDSVSDSGIVDMGYHYPAAGDLEILRGTEAGVLQPYRIVQSLPFRDDPGSLTDPLTPLLFYEIPVATQPIRLEKDMDEERLVLRF